MKPFFLLSTIAVLALIFSACNSRKDIVEVRDDDREMNEAIVRATATLSEFRAALIRADSADDSFSIKIKVDRDDGGGEHIWIGAIELKGDSLSGLVTSAPEFTDAYTMWQPVTIDPNSISDWMYIHNDTLVGGYTIRVLYGRMSEPEKISLEEELEAVID